MNLQSVLAALALKIGSCVPIGINQFFGKILGRYFAASNLSIKHIAATNISLCLPELPAESQQLMLKQNLIESAKTFFEFPNFWYQAPEKLLAMIDATVGEDHVRTALKRKKGLIILAPHLGAFELLNIYLSSQYDMVTLYRAPKKKYLDPLMKKARERLGTTMMPTNTRGVKALYKALVKEKRVIAILPDQDPGLSGGRFVPFFGIKAWTMTLVSKLARKSQAPVFYVYAKRLPAKGRFEIHFHQADDDIYNADELLSMKAMNKGIEQCVMTCPNQYQWPYKRFKRRPKDEMSLY